MPLGALQPVDGEHVRLTGCHFAGTLVTVATFDDVGPRLPGQVATVLGRVHLGAALGDHAARRFKSQVAHATQGFEWKLFHWNIPIRRATESS